MRLWIPGPTFVREELLAECARPMIGHRSKAMTALIERIDPHLRLAFGLPSGSRAQVAVHTCSATGMMEAALRGVGPRTLALVAGAFGRRWFEIAKALGKQAHALEVPMGEAVEPEALASFLENAPPFDAVTLVSNETSTGVVHDLAGLAAAMRRFPRTLFLVDLVSYLAGAPVDFDAHGFDFALAGSQKALALPPGITVVCASPRYLEGARALERGSTYLDPVEILDGHAARKTPSTPAVGLYFGLARQLEEISAGVTLPEAERGARGEAAWRARFAVHRRMRDRTLAWAEEHGLEPLPAPAHRSPTVSCIRSGAVDVAALVKGLESRGHQISEGYGELKGRSFRIGHMGDHTERDLEELLACADAVLAG
jgi:aspartate aminotransferase-like enzyme